MSAWTREAIEALGLTTDVPTTARILGVNAETIYMAIRRGDWSATRVLRIGRSIKIPTLDLVRLLCAPEATPAAPTSDVPSGCQHKEDGQVTGPESHTQCGCGVAPKGPPSPLRSVV